MRRLAVFRCDASPELGGGHVARCLVLADAMRDQGWSNIFAVQPGTAKVAPSLGASGHDTVDVEPRSGEDGAEAESIRDRIGGGCDLLVVDHYGLGVSFERAARGWAKRIAVIDDLARAHDCDVLLDPTPGREPADYRAVQRDCRLLLGPSYAPIRPEFAALRDQSLARRRAALGLRRMLIGFGATDSLNMTASTLLAVQSAGLTMDLDVVLGSGAPHLEEVRALVAKMGKHIRIHAQPPNVGELIAAADLAAGAAGMMSWERCCLGIPALVVTIAANQLGNAAGLESAGAAILVGNERGLDRKKMSEAVRDLSASPDRLARMSQAAAGICDGRGAERAVAEFVK